MRETMTRSLNPRSAMARWGQKLGQAVGGGGGGAESPGVVEDGDLETPPLGAMTIDRVVEQLFFVRMSVYNAKGKLSEAQQVVPHHAMQGLGLKYRSSVMEIKLSCRSRRGGAVSGTAGRGSCRNRGRSRSSCRRDMCVDSVAIQTAHL